MPSRQSIPKSGYDKIDFLLGKSREELIAIILERESLAIPVSVLSSGLPPLQAVVKYLHETKGQDIKQISFLLNRNIQTIWTSYRLVQDQKLEFKTSKVLIPVRILSKQNNSILESAVHYLMSVYDMRLCEIAKILGKSIKTVWTCNHRYMIKGGKK